MLEREGRTESISYSRGLGSLSLKHTWDPLKYSIFICIVPAAVGTKAFRALLHITIDDSLFRATT